MAGFSTSSPSSIALSLGHSTGKEPYNKRQAMRKVFPFFTLRILPSLLSTHRLGCLLLEEMLYILFINTHLASLSANEQILFLYKIGSEAQDLRDYLRTPVLRLLFGMKPGCLLESHKCHRCEGLAEEISWAGR